MPKKWALLLVAVDLVASSPALSQEASTCGNAPQISSTTEVTSSVKGELEGKAKFLSSLVGNAELGGKIEAARKELYQSSEKFFAAQNEAYLAYVFCTIIMNDKSLSAQDKLKALQEFRRPLSSLEIIPKLATKDGQVSISKGMQGVKSDTFLDVNIRSTPAQPSELLIDSIDGFPAWVIVGGNYDDAGLLRLFVDPVEGYSSDSLPLLITAEGYEVYRAELKLGAVNEVKLLRNRPFSIDRITRLTSDFSGLKSVTGGVKFDVVISNRTSSDKYIVKFIVLLIGSSNGGCNPNPIVTFKYDINLRASGNVVTGLVSAPEEKEGLPVSGKLVQSYCDGYLIASYDQSVPVSKKSKISYVLSFVGFDRTAKEVIPPKHGSRLDWICELPDADKDAQAEDEFCKNRVPVDEQPIAFLGYTPKELLAMKEKGELDGSFPFSYFLEAGDGISYVAPHISECVLIALAEDGSVGYRTFCPKASRSRSDFADEIVEALVTDGLSARDAGRIAKDYANGEQ